MTIILKTGMNKVDLRRHDIGCDGGGGWRLQGRYVRAKRYRQLLRMERGSPARWQLKEEVEFGGRRWRSVANPWNSSGAD